MGFLQGVKSNVVVLGIVSFLTDVSSEMIFPILPVFLTTFLGVGKDALGLIEGVADSLSSLFDIFFGYWSDAAGGRKKFVTLGYGFSSVSKAGIALATTWPAVLVFRGLDRIGKSIRTSPRDAIIAASSDKKVRGKAFGLHRALDTLGAIAGPLLAYAMLSFLGSTEAAYRDVFFAALVPAFLAVAVILFFVREPKASKEQAKQKKRLGFWKSLSVLGSDYKRFLGVSCFFSLAYFSFALLIARAAEIGVNVENILLVYVLFNVVNALAAVPIGQLSDRIGRKPVIAGAFLLYALVCIGFAFAGSLWQVALLFALYGIFVAADESVNKAYVSDLVGEKQRGTGLGAYNTAVGAVYLPANVLVGLLWTGFGGGVAFSAAAVVAVVAGIALLVYAK